MHGTDAEEVEFLRVRPALGRGVHDEFDIRIGHREHVAVVAESGRPVGSVPIRSDPDRAVTRQL